MQGAGHTHPGSGGYTMVSSGMRGVGAYRWRSESHGVPLRNHCGGPVKTHERK